MKRAKLKVSMSLLLGMLATQAQSEIIKLPEISGWTGDITAGAQYLTLESNVLAGPSSEVLSNRIVQTLTQSPDNDNDVYALFQPNIFYTFASTRTQIFFNSSTQNPAMLDVTQNLGLRQELEGWGIVSGAVVFTMTPANVWRDPYQVALPRDDTERKSNGARLGWDMIAGTTLGVAYTYRDMNIEVERSGFQLLLDGDLSELEVLQLDRNGDVHTAEADYSVRIGEQHRITGKLRYDADNRDGEAYEGDRYAGELQWGFFQPDFQIFASGFYASREYENANPVYGRKADADEYGGTIKLVLESLLPAESLSVVALAGYAKSDSDIDFFDTEVMSFGAGLRWQF